MVATPIERIIDGDLSEPDSYKVSCALCSFRCFTSLKRMANEIWEQHRKDTGHDFGFIRGKLRRRPAPRRG